MGQYSIFKFKKSSANRISIFGVFTSVAITSGLMINAVSLAHAEEPESTMEPTMIRVCNAVSLRVYDCQYVEDVGPTRQPPSSRQLSSEDETRSTSPQSPGREAPAPADSSRDYFDIG